MTVHAWGQQPGLRYVLALCLCNHEDDSEEGESGEELPSDEPAAHAELAAFVATVSAEEQNLRHASDLHVEQAAVIWIHAKPILRLHSRLSRNRMQ
jgi:hypothetical protein